MLLQFYYNLTEMHVCSYFFVITEVFSCFCRFDKRITAFAEEKFQRDGINLKTGSMVVKVTDKEIYTKELKNGGEVSTIPYGMALWSTGVGTRPFIKDFMSQVGQVCLSFLSMLC